MKKRPTDSRLDAEHTDADIRLFVYRHFVDLGGAPSPLDIADHFGATPAAIERALSRLQDRDDALVLLPGSPYIWMAEPFSAVPTSYPVQVGERRYFGNCIWDALAILALVPGDGRASTRCPTSGAPLTVEIADGAIVRGDGIAHFAVPAREWWRSIGHT